MPIKQNIEKIKAQIGTDIDTLEFGTVTSFKVGEATPIFARIDAEKALAEIAAEAEAKAKAIEAIKKMRTEGVSINFASVAKKAGYEQIAELFLKTAEKYIHFIA